MAGEVGPSGDAGAKGEAVCNNLNRNERFYTCVNIAWARLQYMCDYYMRLVLGHGLGKALRLSQAWLFLR